MKNHKILTINLLCIIVLTNLLYGQKTSKDIKHVKVYYEHGMYGGWPANHGIWIWDNEILVGFAKGFYKDPNGSGSIVLG